jgi:GT2 family glycosyltransferase
MSTGAVGGIVVLNWNGREDTLRCLRSLEQVTYPDTVVLVVDNGSTEAVSKRSERRTQPSSSSRSGGTRASPAVTTQA